MEIFAELFYNEKKNEFLNSLPPGITFKRKNNSRACVFECEDNLDKQALIEILENNQVCYQDMDEKEKEKDGKRQGREKR